jgi:hypothetical protein
MAAGSWLANRKARRIAADTYRHHWGVGHPDAPGED